MNADTVVSLAKAIAKWYDKNVVDDELLPRPFISSHTSEYMAVAALVVLDSLQEYQDETEVDS